MTQTEIFNKVIHTIYEDNYSHVDFIDNMGGECDCIIHTTLQFLHEYEIYEEAWQAVGDMAK